MSTGRGQARFDSVHFPFSNSSCHHEQCTHTRQASRATFLGMPSQPPSPGNKFLKSEVISLSLNSLKSYLILSNYFSKPCEVLGFPNVLFGGFKI